MRAETVRTYIDAASNREVYTYHAKLTRLSPNTTYIYAALADGVMPDAGTFETAPVGRSPFTVTSFGDQSVPTTSWAQQQRHVLGRADHARRRPPAGDIVAGIEQVRPLFHLINGDLSYANLSVDRVRTWNDFFTNNERSARKRPWMPAPGNHENELGNGPLGYDAFRTRFAVPSNGSADFEGLWYAFTVGSVRVIVLQNDDVALQDAGDSYVNGYSQGQQKAWLERQLAAARKSREVDWIVVCMHQVIISSANANGSDLGIRETWGPLFDQYEVDLVLCGHEHDYERSLAVRGTVSGSETLTPNPVSTEAANIDTGQGTVHLVLGGGGNSSNTNTEFFTERPGEGDHRGRRPGQHWQAHLDLCDGGGHLVGLPRRGAPLRLRRLRCGPRATARRHHKYPGDVLQRRPTLRHGADAGELHALPQARRRYLSSRRWG